MFFSRHLLCMCPALSTNSRKLFRCIRSCGIREHIRKHITLSKNMWNNKRTLKNHIETVNERPCDPYGGSVTIQN
jgi:hypothetical protein